MNNKQLTLFSVGTIAVIGGLIYLGISSEKQEKERQHQEDMEKARMEHEETMAENKAFLEMSPEDRKAVMVEKEKTKQANAEIKKAQVEKEKAEKEVEKAKMIKDLIDNPLPKVSAIPSYSASNPGFNISIGK